MLKFPSSSTLALVDVIFMSLVFTWTLCAGTCSGETSPGVAFEIPVIVQVFFSPVYSYCIPNLSGLDLGISSFASFDHALTTIEFSSVPKKNPLFAESCIPVYGTLIISFPSSRFVP